GDPDQMIVPRPGEAPWVQVVTPEGEVVAASSEVRGHPSLAGTDVRRGKLLIDGRYCPEALGDCAWVFGLRLRDSPWGPGAVVMAGTPLPGEPNMIGVAGATPLVLAGVLFLDGRGTGCTTGRGFVSVCHVP